MIGVGQYGYIVFFILFMLGLLIEITHPETVECIYHTDDHVAYLAVIHQYLATFILFGWLLPNKYILLLFIFYNIIIQFHWYTHGHCVVTQYVNVKCNKDIDEPLHGIIWALSLGKVNIFGYTIYLDYVIVELFLLLGIYNFYSML